MSTETISLSRRSAIVAAGAGALLVAGLVERRAAAAEAAMTATEQANLKTVADFLAIFSKPETTAEKAITYFTDDCVVRMSENKPPAVGKVAAMKDLNDLFKAPARYKIEILHSFARGPVVATDRIDSMVGDPSKAYPIAGLFVLKDGKIKEWADYLAPKA